MPAGRILKKGDGPTGLSDALLRCNSIAELRALTPMPKDTQELIDDAVVRVGRERLAVVDAMLSAGLTFNIDDPLSVLEVYWEKLSEAGHAQRTMIPGARGEDQRRDYSGTTIPIYATWDDFSLPIRMLRASIRNGTPLDTNGIEMATRNVNVGVEDAAINGAGLTVDANTTPGLINETNVNKQEFVDTEAWTHANHSGQDILQDVLNMVGVLQADKKYGPYTLFVNTTYSNELEFNFGDGVTTQPQTTRNRLLQLNNLSNIVTADLFPDDTVVLAQMTSDVMDVIVGQGPVPVTWDGPGGWEKHFVILAFMVPRFKSDYDGNSGICVGTPSGA
jgi:uncharacterized linocin/CFP29 family protein